MREIGGMMRANSWGWIPCQLGGVKDLVYELDKKLFATWIMVHWLRCC